MGKVYIIGIGPGSKDYIPPVVCQKIEKADCLIGAPRLLSLFSNETKIFIILKDNYAEVIEYIKKNKEKKSIALLVSGDPGFYSFSAQITGKLKREEYEIIPGISSLQIACARIGESWQGMKVISLHGKNISGLEQSIQDHPKLFLLCDYKNTPAQIASYLFQKGIQERECIVFKNLSLQDEQILFSDIRSLQREKVDQTALWVMIIKK